MNDIDTDIATRSARWRGRLSPAVATRRDFALVDGAPWYAASVLVPDCFP